MEIKKVYPALTQVMSSVGAISKRRMNQQQGYQFRGIDDVYSALHDLFANAHLICNPRVLADYTEDRQTSKGGTLIYRVLKMEFDLTSTEDGSIVTLGPVIGEGMDSGDKASSKAMSVAQKYALLQAFLIPTSEPKDPENDSHQLGQRTLDKRASFEKTMLPLMRHPKAKDALASMGYEAVGDVPEAQFRAVYKAISELGQA